MFVTCCCCCKNALFVTFAGAGPAFHLFRIHLIPHLCCPACILSYINHVLRPFCPVNILSCIPPILHLICPSSSESIISCVYTCIHPVLHTLSDMLLFCWQLVLHTLCPPCIYSVLPPSSLLSCIHPVLPPFVQHPFFPICWYSIWRDSVTRFLGPVFNHDSIPSVPIIHMHYFANSTVSMAPRGQIWCI